MGIIYSVRIIPIKPLPFIKYKRLKDIPGSKDIFVSVAWAWIIVLIPMFNQDIYFSYESMSVLAFTLVVVFMRSVVFDVVRIEGDRIVGRETIPILIGTKHTRTILLLFTLIISGYLILSSTLGLIPSIGYYLIISPIFIIFCLYLFHKKRMQPSRMFEAVIDANFILTGIIAYVWQSVH
jgi:4-hydroxy-3-methylbut-2-enyl diphosphate reductase